MDLLDKELDKALDDVLDNLGVQTEDINETVGNLTEDAKENGMTLHNKETDKKKAEKLFYGLTEDDRRQAVIEYIIPPSYQDVKFDEDKIKNNLVKQRIKSGGLYTIHNFGKYIEICKGILSAIRMRELPNRSYIIGAPNGFGKSSFVNECLITLRRQGFRVAPYISLWELAQIRVADEQKIMNPYIHPKTQEEKLNASNNYEYTNPNKDKGYFKSPEIVTGRYSFSEYINADCLFVSLTDVISKDIESHTLYQLLSIRGAKGLPTIVMMSTSLEPYERDPVLKEYVWSEILSYDKNEDSYDRIYHVSCYKIKTTRLENKDVAIDKNTGVVLGE